MKLDRLGWIVAAVLFGGMVGMGFEGGNEKVGSVDMIKVFNECDLARRQNDTLHALGTVRESVFGFLQQNPHMKPEDASKFRDLSLKDDMTAADKAQIEKLKSDAQANESAIQGLMVKKDPTPADQAQLQQATSQKDANAALLEKWRTDFMNDIETKRSSLRSDTMQKVKEAVAQVAKKQGYSIVYSQEVVPYCVNDITAEALNAMNRK